jgi:hypothetical protein
MIRSAGAHPSILMTGNHDGGIESPVDIESQKSLVD